MCERNKNLFQNGIFLVFLGFFSLPFLFVCVWVFAREWKKRHFKYFIHKTISLPFSLCVSTSEKKGFYLNLFLPLSIGSNQRMKSEIHIHPSFHIPISLLSKVPFSIYIKHLLNNLNVRVKTIHNFLILLRDSFGAILLARTHIYTCTMYSTTNACIRTWHGLHVKRIKSLCETENSNGNIQSQWIWGSEKRVGGGGRRKEWEKERV